MAALPRHAVSPLGTDNVMIRLGDTLAVRMPRTLQASAALTKEQRFLPLLAPHLPLKIPAPIRFGEPDGDYPWPWSVYPWIAGRNPAPGEADIALAGDLADFGRTLHEIDTFGLRSEGPLHSTAPIRFSCGMRLLDKASMHATNCSIGRRLPTSGITQDAWRTSPAHMCGHIRISTPATS